MVISKKIIMMQQNQVLKHKHVERYILIIAVNKFKNNKTNVEEAFCTYYWCEYGLVGTDLLENIERDYEVIINLK
jgi:hypothetical protein